MKNKFVLIVNLLVNMGIGLIMPVTMLYIHNDMHKSLVTAGYVLLGFSGAMAIGNLIGGHLFDQWKSKPLMYIGSIGLVIILGLLSIMPIWPVYSILLIAYGLFLGVLNATINSYLAYLQHDDINIFNNGYWAANIGMGLSTFLSGLLYSINIRLVFSSSAILFLLVVFTIRLKFDSLDNSNHNKRDDPKNANQLNFKTLLSVMIISVAMLVIWIGYEQWNSNISVLMTNDGISVQKYSALFTISTIEIVLLQPLIVRLFNTTFKYDKLKLILGILFFALSYLIIIGANDYWRFIIGISFIYIGEILALTAIPSLLNRYATNYNRGTIQSIGSLSGAFGRALGPLTGSYLITNLNYNLTFEILFIIHVLVTVLIMILKPDYS